jgi:hypothetical protein
MAIPILAGAFTIYIFGIATVLFLKPKIMFGETGEWKEFGIGRGERRTVFPFWLFSIFWAFISYGLALVIMSQFATIAVSAFPEPSISNTGQYQQPSMQQPSIQQPSIQQPSVQQPVYNTPTPQVSTTMPPQQPLSATSNFIKPVSSSLGIQSNTPGYYILQTNGVGESKYIYYGTEPPKL